MKVYKVVPKAHLPSIEEHGLLSISRQIELGLREAIAVDDAFVLERMQWLYFSLDSASHSRSSPLITLAYDVVPKEVDVCNARFTIDTTEPVDPRYHASQMTLDDFLQRTEGHTKYLLTPVRADVVSFTPENLEVTIGLRQIRNNFYDPEVIVKRSKIPFRELSVYSGE